MKTLLKWTLVALAFSFGSAVWGQNVYNKFSPATGVLKGSATSYFTTAAASSDIRGLWSGTCDATTFLRGDGACASASVSPGGSNTQVQFNNSSAFGGSSNFVWDNTNNILKLTGAGGGILTAFTGQPLNLLGGDLLADTTNSTITLGSNGASGNGGAVTISSGNAATSGVGGSVALNAGNAAGTNHSGGSISFSAGNPTGIGAGGIISFNTLGSLRGFVAADGGFVAGSPTGGSKGAGSVNAQSLYINGTAVSGSGTVSSVALTMPSGFSVSGSPVTTSGTLGVTTALSGVLKGNGSGFTTSTAADIIGLWSGTCSSSTFLRGDGACAAAGGGGTPGGSNTQVQYNSSGSFAGDSGLTYISGTRVLTVGGGITMLNALGGDIKATDGSTTLTLGIGSFGISGAVLGTNGLNAIQFVTNNTIKASLISGLTLNAPTGGDKGSGTINAQAGIYVNGTAVPAGVAHLAACYVTVSGTTPTLVNTFGCSGVSRAATGHYTVTFNAGFGARPPCTVSAYGGDFIAFTSDPSNSGTMDFLFDNITGGTRADPAGFMITCLGN